jgi:hypothetical protein
LLTGCGPSSRGLGRARSATLLGGSSGFAPDGGVSSRGIADSITVVSCTSSRRLRHDGHMFGFSEPAFSVCPMGSPQHLQMVGFTLSRDIFTCFGGRKQKLFTPVPRKFTARERILRIGSHLEPLNRSSRRKSALIFLPRRWSALTSAPSFMEGADRGSSAPRGWRAGTLACQRR